MGTHGEFGAGLALKRRRHEALVAIGDGGVEYGGENALATRPTASQARNSCLAIDIHANAQLPLALAAVDGEDTVIGDAAQRLVVGIVWLERGLFGGVGGLNNDIGGVLSKGAQVGDVLGVFGDNLGNDI